GGARGGQRSVQAGGGLGVPEHVRVQPRAGGDDNPGTRWARSDRGGLREPKQRLRCRQGRPGAAYSPGDAVPALHHPGRRRSWVNPCAVGVHHPRGGSSRVRQDHGHRERPRRHGDLRQGNGHHPGVPRQPRRRRRRRRRAGLWCGPRQSHRRRRRRHPCLRY
ncbi:unnamed protein product, partial [Ectocarpus fasciculatus]